MADAGTTLCYTVWVNTELVLGSRDGVDVAILVNNTIDWWPTNVLDIVCIFSANIDNSKLILTFKASLTDFNQLPVSKLKLDCWLMKNSRLQLQEPLLYSIRDKAAAFCYSWEWYTSTSVPLSLTVQRHETERVSPSSNSSQINGIWKPPNGLPCYWSTPHHDIVPPCLERVKQPTVLLSFWFSLMNVCSFYIVASLSPCPRRRRTLVSRLVR